jgi:hypothetical protein
MNDQQRDRLLYFMARGVNVLLARSIDRGDGHHRREAIEINRELSDNIEPLHAEFPEENA